MAVIFILALSFSAIVTSMFVGGLIPILLGIVGILGWIEGASEFVNKAKKISNITDIKEADKEMNNVLIDATLLIFSGWLLGKAIKGLGNLNMKKIYLY